MLPFTSLRLASEAIFGLYKEPRTGFGQGASGEPEQDFLPIAGVLLFGSITVGCVV